MPLIRHHTASKHFQEKQRNLSRFILHREHGKSSQICLKDSVGNKDVSWSWQEAGGRGAIQGPLWFALCFPLSGSS